MLKTVLKQFCPNNLHLSILYLKGQKCLPLKLVLATSNNVVVRLKDQGKTNYYHKKFCSIIFITLFPPLPLAINFLKMEALTSLSSRAATGEFGFTPFLIKNVQQASNVANFWALFPSFTLFLAIFDPIWSIFTPFLKILNFGKIR